MSPQFPFKPINSGQQFREGIDLSKGRCVQCGRKGNVAALRLHFSKQTPLDRECCAECLADFIAGASALIWDGSKFATAKVFGKTGGEWKELRGKVAP